MEIARTGQFGFDGTTLTFQDLTEAVETFGKTAPVTIGHQMTKEDWFPQFGQILSVKLEAVEGDDEASVLIGDVEFNELAAEAFEQGLYTGWSVSLPRRPADGKRYIHHLALLGAVPPKIRDLKILQEMKKPVPADFGENGSISSADVFCFLFSDEITNREEKKEVTDEEAKKLEEENAALKKKVKDLEKNGKDFADVNARLTATEQEIKAEKIKALSAAAEGKVPAAQTAAVKELGDVLFGESHEFADADGNKTSRRAVDVLIDVLSAIPKPTLDNPLDFSDPADDPKGRYGGVNRSDLANKM